MTYFPWASRLLQAAAWTLGLMASAGAEAPIIDQTRILDRFTITNPEDFLKKSMPVKSAFFKSQANAGPIWVVFYYVATLSDPSTSGETLFDVGVTDVKMNPTDTVLLFESGHMTQLDRSKPFKEPGEQGWMTPVNALALKTRLPEDRYDAYLKAIRSDKAVRHLVASKTYDVPLGTTTQFLVGTLRTTNMRPMSLEVVIGQGPVPRELTQFAKKTNGSWFMRYRHGVAAFGALLLLAAVALFKLRS